MKYMLDTCIVSEAVKRKPSIDVMQWLDSVPISCQYLSSVTLGELQKGICSLGEADPRRHRLASWFERVHKAYSGRILPFDEEAALLWGRISGENQRSGRSIPLADSQIAAIAIVHGMELVTRNVRDMLGMGASIVNPFSLE